MSDRLYCFQSFRPVPEAQRIKVPEWEVRELRKADELGYRRYVAQRRDPVRSCARAQPELTHRRTPWKTKEAVELSTLEWVSWFNHHRLLEPIGYIPPPKPRPTTIGNLPN